MTIICSLSRAPQGKIYPQMRITFICHLMCQLIISLQQSIRAEPECLGSEEHTKTEKKGEAHYTDGPMMM